MSVWDENSYGAKTKPPDIQSSGPALVSETRDFLESYAQEHNYTFQQDTIGNITITKPGTDPELSGIALPFPLDDRSASQNLRFNGALHVLESLGGVVTKCDVLLLGWSSSADGKVEIGKQVWEEDMTVSEAYAELSELRQLEKEGSSKPEELYLSAIVEVVDDGTAATGQGSGKLEVEGSLVLIDKVKKISGNEVVEKKTQDATLTSNKASIVRIGGKGAIEVGAQLVKDYSHYVAGLFENFD